MTDADLAELLACLKDCADDLESEIRNTYCEADMRQYPRLKSKFDLGMEPVVRARALLAKFAKAAE